MRIDAYNQISKIYNVQKPAKAQSVQKSGYVSDQLSISQTGRDYQVAKKAVAEASDIREDKISKLKSMIDSGNYQVDAGDFAGRLLAKFNQAQM